MRYLGGKHKIARLIVSAIAADLRARGVEPAGLPWWDPFCGGLSVAVLLASLCGAGSGVVSDGNTALMAMYEAVRAGTWNPPEVGTLEEWEAAKAAPDSDPRKAFYGVAGSYGGMWFSTPQVSRNRRWNRHQNYWCDDNPIGAGRSALLRDLPQLVGAELAAIDFLDCPGRPFTPAGPRPRLIYCDPPYEGVAGYAATGPFDHAEFWRIVARLANLPDVVGVYVSEYSIPPWVRHEVIWSRASGTMIGRKGSGLDKRAHTVDHSGRTEYLFRILPGGPTDSSCAA